MPYLSKVPCVVQAVYCPYCGPPVLVFDGYKVDIEGDHPPQPPELTGAQLIAGSEHVSRNAAPPSQYDAACRPLCGGISCHNRLSAPPARPLSPHPIPSARSPTLNSRRTASGDAITSTWPSLESTLATWWTGFPRTRYSRQEALLPMWSPRPGPLSGRT